MESAIGQILQVEGAVVASVPVRLLLPRLLAAIVVGVLLALRPWRFVTRKPLPKPEMIQAQILLCAAAAVITMVIGDSVAKAFGLVGLGSFVRFRSGLKDPRDAAILFLVIGLGMACGHGSIAMAVAAAGFVAALLAVLDFFKGSEPIADEEPRDKRGVLAAAVPTAGTAPFAPMPLAHSPNVNAAVNAAIPAAPRAP